MNEAGSNGKVAGRPHYQQPRDFYFALGVAVLAFLLHAAALAADLAAAGEFNTLASPIVPRLLLAAGLCLLVNAVGLWLRSVRGTLVSLTALSGAAISYLIWYAYSRHTLDLLSARAFYQLHPEALPPHPFGLLGATWLNLVVLALAGVLFIWEAKTLRGTLRPLR